jgi:hypothetical protein
VQCQRDFYSTQTRAGTTRSNGLGEAADAFERVANVVVQSTLLKLCSPLELLSRLPSPSLISFPGQRAGSRMVMRSLR